uniref:hypothetical protein n=1 Tax=Streptomyces chartreusis TaxID=1969 RepID=UPI003F499E94
MEMLAHQVIQEALGDAVRNAPGPDARVEALVLVAQGYSNTEIATDLCVTEFALKRMSR